MSKPLDAIQPMKVTFILQQIKKTPSRQEKSTERSQKMPAWPQHWSAGTGRDSGCHPPSDSLGFSSESMGSKINHSIISSYENQTPNASQKCHIPRAGQAVLELQGPQGVVSKKLCRNFLLKSKSVRWIQHLRDTRSKQEHHPHRVGRVSRFRINSQRESGLSWRG